MCQNTCQDICTEYTNALQKTPDPALHTARPHRRVPEQQAPGEHRYHGDAESLHSSREEFHRRTSEGNPCDPRRRLRRGDREHPRAVIPGDHCHGRHERSGHESRRAFDTLVALWPLLVSTEPEPDQVRHPVAHGQPSKAENEIGTERGDWEEDIMASVVSF